MGLLDLKSNLSRQNFKREIDERLPSKDDQAIIDVQDRTRAREKQIAEIKTNHGLLPRHQRQGFHQI